MMDKKKVLARTLQVDTGWSYMACRNLLTKHNGDYTKALDEARSTEAHNRSLRTSIRRGRRHRREGKVRT